MDEIKHAPLPWRIEGNIIVDAEGKPVHSHEKDDGCNLVLGPTGEFVVRACNAFPALVALMEALELVLKRGTAMQRSDQYLFEVRDAARAALALARGDHDHDHNTAPGGAEG